jgi:hypothetical protein
MISSVVSRMALGALSFAAVLAATRGCAIAPYLRPAGESLATDALFSKRLECGKLSANLRGSDLNTTPLTEVLKQEADESKLGGGGLILYRTPLVFYSPILNTCLLLSRTDIRGVMVVTKEPFRTLNVTLEDLLTSNMILSKDFNLRESESEAEQQKFADVLLKKYGFDDENIRLREGPEPQRWGIYR